jgi:predicted DNA-binding protein (UPF0251 family)
MLKMEEEIVPRKRCCSMVEFELYNRKFSPMPTGCIPRVEVGLEELEALRLKDLEGKKQAECAAMMGLSRPTFQRVLYKARAKVARALVEGREICIMGGNYKMKNRKFLCTDCGNQWEVEPCTEGGKHGYEIPCPSCGSMKKSKIEDDGNLVVCGGAHQHGENSGCGCGNH